MPVSFNAIKIVQSIYNDSLLDSLVEHFQREDEEPYVDWLARAVDEGFITVGEYLSLEKRRC